MQPKVFKYLILGMFALGFFSIYRSLTNPKDTAPVNYKVNVTQVVTPGKGLDLQAVGELLKKAKSAEEFEKLLNEPNNGVNNLDLNGDGKVDFIKVTEFGEGKLRGFSLTTEPAAGQVQELATIKIAQEDADKAQVELRGNPQIYPQNNYYQSSWGGLGTGLGAGLMLGYLFGSHRPYVSPYSYGYYPPRYQPYASIPPDQYERRAGSFGRQGNYTQTTRGRFDHLTSPHQGRNAAVTPPRSQMQFQPRTEPKPMRQGGFGRVTRPSAPPPSRGFGGGGGRGFGGGGGRRR